MNSIPKGMAIIFVVIVVVIPILCMALFERVPPMDIGVRQALLGGGGITKEDKLTGTYLGITGIHKWHYLPRRTHFLHFTQGSSSQDSIFTQRGVETTMFHPPMELRTKDNNTITLDVTVPYKIIEGEGWMIVDEARLQQYRGLVKRTVENVLRAELPQLSSEDLQSTDKRVARATDVLPMLNAQLAEFHVQAEFILIRRVQFAAEYESKLQEKQYFTQKALLNSALALQANEERVTNSIEKQIGAKIKAETGDWDIRIQEKRSEYEVKIAVVEAAATVYESRVRAEGDAELVTLEAEGQLAVDKAEALRNELRNAILNSTGGHIFLALEAASNLNVREITLNSNDPRVPLMIDIGAMSKMLVGEVP
jgi:regulator of protease activity HflC (stomatin/prohibitin superfamily)